MKRGSRVMLDVPAGHVRSAEQPGTRVCHMSAGPYVWLLFSSRPAGAMDLLETSHTCSPVRPRSSCITPMHRSTALPNGCDDTAVASSFV